MPDNTTLREMFVEELRDAHHAESQLVKALPKMAKAATTPELKSAIEQHLEETKNHVERIEQIFESLNENLSRKVCHGMKGIIQEGNNAIKEFGKSDASDAGIIAGAQKVEHYEIALYGTLCAWAEQLGEQQCCELLGSTLEEEKAADQKLTEIAEARVNREASMQA
jgi:ferritin-like metal-binding protein YciE